jgi:hypothetical protein
MTTQPVEETVARTERRQFHRKKFRGSIEIEWGSALLTGLVRDIGPSGLFVELAPPLWLGAEFRARLLVSPVLLLDCTVARVEPGVGFAVQFEMTEESGKARLEALLLSLPSA